MKAIINYETYDDNDISIIIDLGDKKLEELLPKFKRNNGDYINDLSFIRITKVIIVDHITDTYDGENITNLNNILAKSFHVRCETERIARARKLYLSLNKKYENETEKI
jgi:hypothetical protein